MDRSHLDLPASKIEREFECGPVGELFTEALAWHLGGSLAGRELAVIVAAGVIGEAVAAAAAGTGMRPHVRHRAKRPLALNNFDRLDIRDSLADALHAANVVVGATGKTILRARHLRSLRDGAILASASSGRYEFPIGFIEPLSDGAVDFRVAPDRPADGTTFTMIWGKALTVLDGGRPLNLGIAAGSGHGCFDLIIALLAVGAAEVAAGRYDGRIGFLDVFDDICRRHDLADIYMLLHGENA